MNFKEKTKSYILSNKDKYSRELIDKQLTNSNIPDEIIKESWNEINNMNEESKILQTTLEVSSQTDKNLITTKKRPNFMLIIIILISICGIIIGGLFFFSNYKGNNSSEFNDIEVPVKYLELSGKNNPNLFLKVTGYSAGLDSVSNKNELTINLFMKNYGNQTLEDLNVEVKETNLKIQNIKKINLLPDEEKIINYNFNFSDKTETINIEVLAQNNIGDAITHRLIYLDKNARPVCYEDDNRDQYVYGKGEYKSSTGKYRDKLIEDKCGITGNDPTKLIEGYCENGEPTSKEIICENGCRNGECIR